MSPGRADVQNPPRWPEWIIRRLAWAEDRSSILENLREEYAYLLSTKGAGPAVLWYWGHCLRSIVPFLKFLAYWRFAMFKNYLKLVLRGISKHKGYSAVNIAGLAVGLASFILISLWINYETSFDRFHENKDGLYQLVTEQLLPNGERRQFINTPGALAPTLEAERPEIRNVSRSVEWMDFLLGTQDKRSMEGVRFVDPAFLEMFSLEFIEGNSGTALSQPHSIVLTEHIANRLFADGEAVGREIMMGQNQSLLVTGVIKDFPPNSSLRSLSLVPIAALRDLGWDHDQWTSGNYHTYVHLEEKTDLESFKAQIRDVYERNAPNWERSTLTLRPVTKIHLHDLSGGGPIVYVYIFSGLSLFVLLLAMVNYTNLATARSFLRAKEIGVRKTAGAYRRQLTKQILMESILTALVSGCLAVPIAYFLVPVLNGLTGARVGFDLDGKTALFLTGVVVLTGVVSGLYPAFILSSMNPVRALKGAVKPGKNSLLLRKVLIAFQFSLSIFMVVAMLGVNKQLKYLNTKELGYSRSHVVSMGLDREISGQYRTIQTEVLRNPDILSMTRSSSSMERPNTTTGGPDVTWEGNAAGVEMPRIHLMRADPEFVETFQIEMAEGRFFSHEFPRDVAESAVINETAWKAMGLDSPVGKRLTIWDNPFRIIGVIKDFHFYSLREEIQPLILVHRFAGFQRIFFRINSQNVPEALDFIRNTIKEIVPGYVPSLRFLDDNLQEVYLSERRMGTATRYFTLLAIFVSGIGLLGLASFSARQRTKEIAVRKVLGASEGKIVLQLLRETLISVVAANIVVYPVAYLALRGWLQNYAYHTTLGIGIFALASVSALALAVLSVGWNILKASLANPVDSLRYE
ncbi:MAG: ABC transporter permease [Candidatus Aminicenantes bacterium]|nr:ABC transporter permease [Candidatus Aminicenantes bacterium]